MDAGNIETRPLWKPMHLQPVFAGRERLVDGTSEGFVTVLQGVSILPCDS